MGKGSKKDEGSFPVVNSNGFAALGTLRKKRKSDKGGLKGDGAGKSKEVVEEKQVYWAPAPLTVKSWADVDDEDDDDFYATTVPPQTMWGGSTSAKAEELEKHDLIEESESEDELVDEVDDEVGDEREHEHENETDVHHEAEPVVKDAPAPEKQLSKKERKKKELAELEAILADFGVTPRDEQSEVPKDKKENQVNGVEDKKDVAVADSKTAKKKKKKEKSSKEEKDAQDQANDSAIPEDTAQNDESSVVDVKERLKKVATAKKKKSGKEVDGAARAVALEAAARNAKLAAAKKKEKSHYNQQPTR